MSEKKWSISKRFATLGALAAVAVMVVIVFGDTTFSRDHDRGLTITEYDKEAVALAGVARPVSNRSGTTDLTTTTPPSLNADLSKALLNVDGLSCSSCIQKIKDALSPIEGIEEILVDISRSTVQVYYNGKTLKEPNRLALAVTSHGYPATLLKIFASEDLRKEEAVAAARSQYYIASVGGWDIARPDFDTQLEHAKKRYEKIYGDDLFSTARGKSLVDNLRAQIVVRLIDEGVMMQEITKAGYRVTAEAVEDELEKVMQQSGKGPEEFKEALVEDGMTFEYFKKRLETQLLISGYLEEKILTGASSDVEKRTLFVSWFNNSKILADVSYYDKALERLVQQQSAQGTCGGRAK